jgi:hypothetical protein
MAQNMARSISFPFYDISEAFGPSISMQKFREPIASDYLTEYKAKSMNHYNT